MEDYLRRLMGAWDALKEWLTWSLVVAALGQVTFHAKEVMNGQRPAFWKRMIWAMPTAILMSIVADGIARYFDLSQVSSLAVAAYLGWLGPSGLMAFSISALQKKGK